MHVRRYELLLLFLAALALNWVGTMWWLSDGSFVTAWASEMAAPAAAPQAAATIPPSFSYQGTLRDAQGKLINSPVNLTVRLYKEVTGGSPLHSENFSNVNVRDGMFSVVVGDAAPIAATVFDNFPLYLGLSVNSGAEMLPRQRLHPVPWAMQATTAQTAVTANNLAQGGGVPNLVTFGAGGAKQISFPDGGKIIDSATGLSISGGGANKAVIINGPLTVNGDWKTVAIRDKGDSNGNTVRSTYPVSITRYVVEAADQGSAPDTVPLDDAILVALCGDEDGCTFTLGMRNWLQDRGVSDVGILATVGPARFSVSPVVQGRRWWSSRTQVSDGRLSSDPNDGLVAQDAQDGDGINNPIARAWDCYFTDNEYTNGAESGDALGFGLLNWYGTHNGDYQNSDMTCVLIIDD